MPQGGGTRDFSYGVAGHLELFEAGGNEVDFLVDDDGRLGEIARLPGQPDEESVELLYDGRSFLSSVVNGTGSATPTYSSDGLLLALERQDSGVAPVEEFSVFYFAGRPVAQLKEVDASPTFTYLTTDHLGTPLLATDEAGVDVWAGPFDPFGGNTFGQALESDVFLRLPGRWADSLWQGASSGANVYYNVHRWYQYGTGRYGRVDPLRSQGDLHPYAYAASNPLLLVDPLGEKSRVCCRKIPVVGVLGFRHCYVSRWLENAWLERPPSFRANRPEWRASHA